MHKERKKTARERCIEVVIRNTGWSYEEAARHIDDARGRLGIKYIEYRRCRMWEMPVCEQNIRYQDYLEKKQIEEEEKRTDEAASIERKKISETIAHKSEEGPDEGPCYFAYSKRILGAINNIDLNNADPIEDFDFDKAESLIGSLYLPDLSINRFDFRQFKKRFIEHKDIEKDVYSFMLHYVDWLFFCKDEGYDMDDYFDYEIYNKSREARDRYANANFRDNLRKALNKDPGILSNKMRFLESFAEYIERPWIDCTNCSLRSFAEFIEESPVIFAKKTGGSGGDGVARIVTKDIDPEKLLAELRQKRCIAEKAIIQHPELSEFNKGTVNTIRIVTLYSSTDDINIIGAAIRFGRIGSSMDNFHQGGICALVDTATGTVISDAADRNGYRYEAHPDSGKCFRGFRIPVWNEAVKKAKAAAENCKETNRLIGWDLAITSDCTVDIIEGNSRPGFDILQVPDMTGRKAEYEKQLQGLLTLEEMHDTKTGYWRKKAISI